MFEVYDLKILFDIVMVRLVSIKVLDLSTGMLTYNKAAGVISPYFCYSNVFEPLITKICKTSKQNLYNYLYPSKGFLHIRVYFYWDSM